MAEIDHAGTTPGLVEKPSDGPPQVSMKCRNEGCPSKLAVQLAIPHSTTRMYQCVVCRRTWGASVGGAFNL